MERPDYRLRPSKEDIALLPPFEGLPLDRIHVVSSPAQIKFARRKLEEARFIGFDTESKPVFTKEAVRDGPHVVQLATLEHAFIVQVNPTVPHEFLKEIIESTEIVKVGFGLKSDRGPLRRKLGISFGSSVDLAHAVRKLGYHQAVGVKAAVAIVLERKLQKTKSITTSNWALHRLRPNQLLYAANDAHAAIAIFHAMGMPYTPVETVAPSSPHVER